MDLKPPTVSQIVDQAVRNAAETGFRAGAQWSAKRTGARDSVTDLHERQKAASEFSAAYVEGRDG